MKSRSGSGDDARPEKTVSIAGKIKFRGGEHAHRISGRDSIQTGGGAYIGGSVTTGGGDFVGRDQVKTFYREDASVDDLRNLVQELGEELAKAGLDTEVAVVAEDDLRVVAEQVARERPIAGLVRAKLGGLSELIRETGKDSESAEKILRLLDRGTALVRSLF